MTHDKDQDMNRRTMLANTGALTLATLASGCTIAQGNSAAGTAPGPIVLVHGAWHGGWCWKKLTPLLAAAGHAVYTPTHTGLGDRAHLARPEIDLETHIQDVLAFLEAEDLREVMLVGHSSGGFVISAVAERARSRLRSLVYLDAFVPENGRSVLDYIHQPERRAAMVASGRATGYSNPIPLKAFGVTREEDLAWANPRIVRQPFATFEQPIRLARPAASGLPRAFIACTKPASGTFDQFAEVIRKDPSWKFHDLATGHDAMITAPQELGQILRELA
jgi:pimeloyl-ACP methyl ester carboxylesterase